jgi:ABC-type dipeptide/oligopeptide/nickel transport system permease subunit
VLSRLIYGSRVSLQVAFAVVVISLTIGTTFGAIAGFAGGWIDRSMVVVNDVLMAFPGFLLALAIVAARGSTLESGHPGGVDRVCAAHSRGDAGGGAHDPASDRSSRPRARSA